MGHEEPMARQHSEDLVEDEPLKLQCLPEHTKAQANACLQAVRTRLWSAVLSVQQRQLQAEVCD